MCFGFRVLLSDARSGFSILVVCAGVGILHG